MFPPPRHTLATLLLLAGAVWCSLPSQSSTVAPRLPLDYGVSGPNVNVSTILSAVGTPYCMRRCLGRLALAAKKLLAFNETTARFQDLCSAFAATKECLDARIHCGPRNVYDAVTSGMEYTCVTKRASFDRVEPCLREHVDPILQTCDSSCLLRANLSAFSTAPTVQMAAQIGGNLLMVAKHLPPFCSAVQCALPCILERANAVCPLSGWLILDSVLQPFDKAAALFAKAPPLMQQLVREQLSDRCAYLFDVTSLADMRKGKF
ncbi:hypothetical protein PENTCL1PPCAC_1626 [Pristionchus entomophagus]|uniref:Chondroitin proteoglycan 4 domain-containing protein n=1 Tax=Pristionchus entomophagus TaxID=358040 RepID=A0AAV5S8Q4_9BILA|nr:hypothetical protein PENTCL1PPCAC_1626 [Pristionchus entomophagus]